MSIYLSILKKCIFIFIYLYFYNKILSNKFIHHSVLLIGVLKDILN